MSDNLQRITKKPDDAEQRIEDFQQVDLSDVNPSGELLFVLGLVVWDIFSNNHEVFDDQGIVFDLGSFRGSAGEIAGFLNQYFPISDRRYDYMDFYMGTIWIRERADLSPLHRHVFSILKARRLDWRYSFPVLHAISFKQPEHDTNPEDYDPTEGALSELDVSETKADRLNSQFEADARQRFEEEKYERPSRLVQSYFDVYGKWPDGHPLAKL